MSAITGAEPSTPIDVSREPAFTLGQATVQPSVGEVRAGGRVIRLEPRVMQVFVALARAQGGVVSRDDLIASCWSGRIVGDDAINRCIVRLRRLAETEAPGSFTIETFNKIGYRLAPAQGSETQRPPPDPPTTPPGPIICVLPFVNMSGDPEQEYFSDGISEDIITDLSKVSALQVCSRNTAFTFKGASVRAPDLARELGVSHVLEGSVRRAGGRVRITAQLVDGATGNDVWADRYDRDVTDIFGLQDEISEAIVSALRLKLLPAEKLAIERRGTSSADAYDLYLLARQRWISGNYGDLGLEETTVRLCRQAVQIDPAYAQAWALMGSAQTNLRFTFGKSEVDCWTAVERALALDPDLAEVHALKARLLHFDGRYDEAAEEVAIALRLDPESYEANAVAGRFYHGQRLFEDAIRHWEKAAVLTEINFAIHGMLISCYTALGDAEGARRSARTSLARAEATLAQDKSNGAAMGFGVTALAVLGEAERARDWIRRALLIDPENEIMRYNCACALSVHLRDIDGALALLGPYFDRATRTNLNHVKADPDMDPLRDDPRFQAMIAAAAARLAAEGPSAAPAQ
jgi:adenylate cyclase